MNSDRWMASLAGLVMCAGCTSVTYGPAGYERRSVPLPRLASGGEPTADVIVVRGRELRFDEALRLYRVTDLPDHYYSAGWFYRRCESGWERARSIDGSWVASAPIETPGTLHALLPEP